MCRLLPLRLIPLLVGGCHLVFPLDAAVVRDQGPVVDQLAADLRDQTQIADAPLDAAVEQSAPTDGTPMEAVVPDLPGALDQTPVAQCPLVANYTAPKPSVSGACPKSYGASGFQCTTGSAKHFPFGYTWTLDCSGGQVGHLCINAASFPISATNTSSQYTEGVKCPYGTPVGGGCACANGGKIYSSYQDTSTGRWECGCNIPGIHSAWAICAQSSCKVVTRLSAVQDLQLTGIAVAQCKPTEVLIGGGCRVGLTKGLPDLVLTESAPVTGTLGEWKCVVDLLGAPEGTLVAQAICSTQAP